MIKKIKNFDDYGISDSGDVYKNGKKLKPAYNIDGYRVVGLYKDGKPHHRRIARLVAQTFIPNPQNHPIVNHIDHTRTNDHISNLEWCTHKRNTQASVEKHPERWRTRAEIDIEIAHQVCQLIQDGLRNKDIQKQLNLPLDTIKHIRSGATWKTVSRDYKLKPSRKGISEETCRWVCAMIAQGRTNRKILDQSSSKTLTKDIIKNIRAKRSWEGVSNEYF